MNSYRMFNFSFSVLLSFLHCYWLSISFLISVWRDSNYKLKVQFQVLVLEYFHFNVSNQILHHSSSTLVWWCFDGTFKEYNSECRTAVFVLLLRRIWGQTWSQCVLMLVWIRITSRWNEPSSSVWILLVWSSLKNLSQISDVCWTVCRFEGLKLILWILLRFNKMFPDVDFVSARLPSLRLFDLRRTSCSHLWSTETSAGFSWRR